MPSETAKSTLQKGLIRWAKPGYCLGLSVTTSIYYHPFVSSKCQLEARQHVGNDLKITLDDFCWRTLMIYAPRWLVLIALCAITSSGHTDEPTLKTPSPVIYLADNLDEKDNLGWCIDTLGRGFAERLQAHSCKPRGGDVQFSFSQTTGQIMSVEFTNYCMADRPNEKPSLPWKPATRRQPNNVFPTMVLAGN